MFGAVIADSISVFFFFFAVQSVCRLFLECLIEVETTLCHVSDEHCEMPLFPGDLAFTSPNGQSEVSAELKA